MSNGKGIYDEEKLPAGACGQPTECYSRVTGYFRPVSAWNKGKKEEFKDRKTFNVVKDTNVPVKLKNIDRYYDPQMGVEYTTADIATGGAQC